MTTVSNPFNIITPLIFHRDYENDLGKNNSIENTLKNNCCRVAQAIVPFISLYKPMSHPLAIALGTVRAISSGSEFVNQLKKGEKYESLYAMLQTTISVVSVASTIFAHPVGMLITTGHDLIINFSQLNVAIKAKDYVKINEVSAHILNNAFHLALFFTGAIEFFVASITIQILLGLYHSSDEFKKGNILEGSAHLLMAAIRTQELKSKIDVIKLKWKLESLFGKIELVDVLMRFGNINCANTPLLITVIRQGGDIESVECLLNGGFNVNITEGNNFTPLCAAVAGQKLDIAKLLILKGADINKGFPISYIIKLISSSKPSDGNESDFNRMIELLEFLLELGAKTNTNSISDPYSGSALKACYNIPQNFPLITSVKKQVFDLLIKYGAKE